MRRFGRFSIHRAGLKTDDIDDEDEESPAFLPLASTAQTHQQPSNNDLGATLRLDAGTQGAQYRKAPEAVAPLKRELTAASSASSASSGIAVVTSQVDGAPSAARAGSALSPLQRAGLGRLSPRRRALGREGSEGSPSMGSSFSDLDGESQRRSPMSTTITC